MNTKQYFGSNKKFLFGNLLNIVVIFSMILTSCGSPKEQAAEEQGAQFFGKGLKWNHYEPPVYTHPEPVVAEHPENSQDSIEQVIQNLPIQFIENVGQFDERALYQAQVGQQTTFLTSDAIWLTVLEENPNTTAVDPENPETFGLSPEELSLQQEDQTIKGVNLKLTFVGANPEMTMSGFDPLDTRISYLGGNSDSGTSQVNVPVWGGIRYENIYKGVDLDMTGNNGNFSWRFMKKDQADNSQIATKEFRIKLEGAQSLDIQDENIVISTGVVNILIPLPEFNGFKMNDVYVQDNEIVFPLFSSASFEKNNNGGSAHFAMFSLPDNQNLKPLQEVPNSTSGYILFLTASGPDISRDIAVDTFGNAYIIGSTYSPDFPVTPGAFNTTPPTPPSNGIYSDVQVFVSKLSADGTLPMEYSTYIGDGLGTSIAVDSSGNAYITGHTNGCEFPTTPGAYDTTYNGYDINGGCHGLGYDAFYAKLSSDGSQLLYSTYLGGRSEDSGSGIALDGNGNVYLVGGTSSFGVGVSAYYPTTIGAYDRTFGFPGEAFITKFNTNGQLLYSTFLGGSESDSGADIVTDADGNAYVTGITNSVDFPTTSGAYDTSFNYGGYDAFVTKINSTGSQLVYSTFVGGSSQNFGAYELGTGIALDEDRNAYITGRTDASDFPTSANAFDTNLGGQLDGFVSKIYTDGSQLIYSSYLGGSSDDWAAAIAVDDYGNAYIVGKTSSIDFPTTPGAFDTDKNYGSDPFLTKLASDGSALVYSTYFGLSSDYNSNDEGTGIAVDADRYAYILGNALGGIFVAKIDPKGSTIHEASVLNSCNVSGECPQSASGNSQGIKFGPINTRTGGLFYQTDDISIPTVAKELNFFRTYSSLSTDLYSSTLGYGWTDNLDTRLIFPTDPGGEEGYILFKAHTANQYQFMDNGNGTYTPAPGIVGSLIFNNGEYVLTYPDQTVYTFDSSGKLASWADTEGHTWQYTYNASGLVEQVSAEGGTRYLALGYDDQGRIISVTDHADRHISFEYDVNGDLVTLTDVMDQDWTYEYEAHRLTKVLDPLGHIIEQTEYDPQGRAIKQWDGEGNLLGTITFNEDGTSTITDPFENTEIHSYDERSTLTESQDGAGGSTDKTYDKNFRPTTITDADQDTTTLGWSADGANLLSVEDALGNQTSITYDPLNNPVTVVGPAPYNYQTTYVYDGNLLTSVMDATQGETTYTYTPEGHLESVTDGEGVTTTYGYDSHGQRISMTDELQNTWEYTYDDLGRLVDQIDPLERVTHNEYDAAGRMTRVTRNYDPNRPQNADNEWNIISEYEYDFAGYQTLVRDTLGRETRYEYDDAGRLIKTIDPELHEIVSEYDEAGRLSVTIDALQHYTYYFYDEAGRLKETKNKLDGIASTIYNLDGTVASTTDEMSRTTYYTYDDLKRVTVVTQPGGGQTKNTYDEPGNLVKVEDPLGNITQYVYDAVGRQIKTIDPDLNETESFYDDAGRLIQTVDARENHTTYEYDETGRLEKVIDQLGGTTTYEYDETGRRSAVIDANLNRTEYTYDRLDRVLAVTNPSGIIFSIYGAAGQVLSRTDANGNTLEYTYTPLGQLETQTDAAGGTTTYGYDVLGNRISVQDANLHTTFMEYDELNRLVRVIDPALSETRTVYDAAGQVVTTFDALNQPTIYEYNELGLQIKVKDPLEHEVQYSYNAAGQMAGMLDANSIATAYEYDALGRLKAVIENYQAAVQPTTEINVRTEYTYDENGNRRTIKDGNGHITNFTYDELNRLIGESDPLDNSWSYGYDAVGNRLSMTDANGITTDYAYDDANRLEGVDSAGTDADVSFEYDAGGRRIGMTDAIGTTTWNYDDLNRPIGITDPFENTVGYAYDAVGNRLGTTYSGREVNYGYDPANRLTQVSDQANNTNYQYDPLGRLTNILRANGVNSTYTYDAAGRLIQLQHGTLENELASYQYAYDAVGNRIQAVEHLKTARTSPTVRLTVVDSSGSLLGGKEVYAFNGDTYTGYHKTTDANGQVAITLPQGDYRFRVDVDGTQFWSANENHCTIGQCNDLLVTIPTPVLIVVTDSDGNLRADIPVYAFISDPSTGSGQASTGFHGVTNAEGALVLRLPAGDYRFRADLNGTQFWSQDTCPVPGCGIIPITVTLPVTVTVLDNIGMPHAGVEVYAFNGTTYTNQHATTDENGRVQMTLPNGNYRFRADFNGTQFWSGPSPSSGENHCTVPDCRVAEVAITLPLIVTVIGTDGSPQQGIPVYVFNGTTSSGFNGTTDANGQVSFTLPAGSYRFRADFNGTQFWSGTQNHCSVPDCSGAQVSVTSSTTITVIDSGNLPKAGVAVYAFNGTTYTNYHGTTDANGQVSLTLPQGSYRFRADYNGTQFWSGGSNHCDIPGCSSASVTVTNDLLVTVQDTDGTPKAGLKVYAFNGVTYTGFNATTNVNGQVTFTLPQGSYRFRADLNGTQFWSGGSNHCTLPGCAAADVTITIPLTVTVQIADGTPQSGIKVYAFNGTTYTGYNATTNVNGLASFTLPQGSYRFRADYNGAQYWSGGGNHCAVPGCLSLTVTVGTQAAATATPTPTATPLPTPTPTETPTASATPTATATPTPISSPTGTDAPIGRLPGNVFAISFSQPRVMPVKANAAPARYDSLTVDEFDSSSLDSAWTWDEPLAGPSWSLTDNPGYFQFTVPPGYEHWEDINTAPSLRRTDMGTGDFAIETSIDFATDSPGDTYQFGLMIGFSETDRLWLGVIGDGQVKINRTQGEDNSTWVSTSMPAFLRIEKTGPEYTFLYKQNPGDDWTSFYGYESSSEAVTYVGMFGRTFAADSDVSYNVDYFRLERTAVLATQTPVPTPTPTLLEPGSGVGLLGKYFDNFTDLNGEPLYTQLDPQLDLGWGEASPFEGIVPDDFSARWIGQIEARSSEEYELGIYADDLLRVWINGQIYIDDWANGQEGWRLGPAIHLEGGQKYDIQIDLRDTGGGAGISFNWHTLSENIDWQVVPMQQLYLPAADDVTTTITVSDTDNSPMEGLSVYAFDSTIYTGFNGLTDENGQVTFSLPDGSYRFRADFNGTQFWSGDENHSNVPGWGQVAIAVNKPVTVHLRNDNAALGGLNVYAFVGDTYTGYHQETNVNGEAVFTLPDGSYRFRADFNTTHFWSGSQNTCDVPDCLDSYIDIASPVTVTVLDTDSTPKEGLNVYAFDETTYTGYQQVTDTNGQAIFTLPFGVYRFRADLNGTQFWSGTENHCDLNNGCESASVTVTKPVIVEVKDQDDTPYAELSVYAFDAETYTGYNGTTAPNGKVTLTLPQGNYHFRADFNGVQFWSSTENDCTIPGCESATIALPGGPEQFNATINYTYDPLYRLVDANYSSGDRYQYTYDAVGNRLMQESMIYGQTSTVNYNYDIANRLTEVDGVPYVYDDNGNLLNDGQNEYVYDSANRLISVSGQSTVSSYQYSGLGDRLSQTVDGQVANYTLDLNAGLTQVLSDGTNTYTYGLGRISQTNTATEYFLGDALGSVRQLTSQSGQVTYAKLYDPYGAVTQVSGEGQSAYGYTGEQQSNDMVYLRARYYNAYLNQFIQPDTIVPNPRTPADWNRYAYVRNNPINFTDPSGHCLQPFDESDQCWQLLTQIENAHSFIDLQTELSKDNYWTYDELLIVQEALDKYDRAAGLDLATLYPRDIKIKRERIAKRINDNYIQCGGTPKYFTSLNRPISIYDGFVDQCVIHELAHHLDFHELHLSKPFAKYVGAYNFFGYHTGPESPPVYNGGNPPNRDEDFAESLTEYVMLNTNYSGLDIGIIPGEKRWYFIESVLDTGKAPSENNDDGESLNCIPSGIALLYLFM